MRTSVHGRITRCGLAGLALLAGSVQAQPEGPDAGWIAELVAMERECHLRNPDWLTRETVAWLEASLELARSYPAEGVEFLDDAERLELAELRRLDNPTLADAYRAQCRTLVLNAALHEMTWEPPLVHGGLAWVPLLIDGDYDGTGMWLEIQDGQWRLSSHSIEALMGINDYTFSEHPRLQARLLRRRQQIAGHPDIDYPDCPLPPPAQPAQVEDPWELLDRRADIWSDEDPDAESNLRGWLQRRALERYGSGVERPPTPSARALYVELLYRRAWFDNGPGLGTPLWAERLREADAALRNAVALGANLTRLAPVIREVATLHARGAGALLVDAGTAYELYEIAAQAGDKDAAMTQARYLAWGLDGRASDCPAALNLLEGVLAEWSVEATIEATWIRLACPDPQHRSVAAALTLLERNTRAQPNWYRADSELRKVTAAASCAQAAESSGQAADAGTASLAGCPAPPAHHDAAHWLAGQFADKQARAHLPADHGIDALPGPHRPWREEPLLAAKSCALPD